MASHPLQWEIPVCIPRMWVNATCGRREISGEKSFCSENKSAVRLLSIMGQPRCCRGISYLGRHESLQKRNKIAIITRIWR